MTCQSTEMCYTEILLYLLMQWQRRILNLNTLKINTANPRITQLIRSEKSSRNTKTRKVNN